jgi:cell division protein FtsB
MPVEGLRAWIGEVERKLAVRTRIFLVLAALAVGVSGAGIYLAVEAHDQSVSESDVRALQEQLEGRINQASAAAGAASPEVTTLQQEVSALRSQVKALEGGAQPGEKGKEGK